MRGEWRIDRTGEKKKEKEREKRLLTVKTYGGDNECGDVGRDRSSCGR